MTTSVVPARPIGGLAVAIGAVTIIGIVAISLFFAVGGFFGPLNDLCNGAEAVLTAVLAWRLYPLYRAQSPGLARVTLSLAWLGALIALVGSVLVIFGVTGWDLAGLYTTLGYALIGMWLFGINTAVLPSQAWPRRLRLLGQVTGAIMVLGLLGGAGIPGGVDSFGAAPWWVNAGFLSGLGWILFYPFWCLWLGRLLLSNRLAPPAPTRGKAPII